MITQPTQREGIRSDRDRGATIVRILIGFGVIYIVFQGSAELLLANGIMRPASFYIVSALALASAFAVERLLFGQPLGSAWYGLGLGWPAGQAVGVAALISAIMLMCYPLLSALTGAQFRLPADWLLMFLGVFLQNGIAEEVMVRGFLFRRLRVGRSFWRAVGIVMLVHGAAHIPIILEAGPVVGFTAVFVALASGIPFAYLFERGGNTIWAPALVHFTADTVLVLIPPAAMTNSAMQMAIVGWLLIVAFVPYLAFALLRPSVSRVAVSK